MFKKRVNRVRERNRTMLNKCNKGKTVVGLEWKMTIVHEVEDDAKGIDISLLAMKQSTIKALRGYVRTRKVIIRKYCEITQLRRGRGKGRGEGGGEGRGGGERSSSNERG